MATNRMRRTGSLSISPQPTQHHIVIVGAGFGGLTAARYLADTNVSVTIIDRRNHHLFQPLLYQVATAGLSPADIATPIRSIFRRAHNIDVILAEVTGVDSQLKEVHSTAGVIPYDTLILATGSTGTYFGNDQWESWAPGLKSLSDATLLRSGILMAFEKAETEQDPLLQQEILTFVLVGGGPTGVEMAGAISELARHALRSDFRHIQPANTRILLLEAGPRILPSFDESLSKSAKSALESRGVEVITQCRVTSIDAAAVHISRIPFQLPSRNVLWCAGVKATPVANWLSMPADRSGRVEVTSQLQIPNSQSIYLIGDAALVKDENGKTLPGLAPVAMQQGRYVARKILRDLVSHSRPSPPFKYRDKGNLATVGRAFAVAEWGKIRSHGFFAWILWLVVHIFYLIGFRNRFFVILQWAWAYLTFQMGARLIPEDRERFSRPIRSEQSFK